MGQGFSKTFNLSQEVDDGNSTVYTDDSAQFVGDWKLTRARGVVRQLVVLASTVASGLGGTFVFEYGEDGATATISESRVITDFATVRDFNLLNAGAYFRIKFTPDRVVTAAEFIFINTTQRRQDDGAFVRLANQEIEEANAAMGQQFSYLKAFIAATGKSTNIRANSTGNLLVADFLTEVAKGNISDHSIVDVSGFNDDIDSALAETIWRAGGIFTPVTAAGTLSIVSDSLLDTNTAGTGARQITVVGLDANYDVLTEVVSLNGIVPVTTVGSFIAVNEAYTSSAGLTGANAGTITALRAATIMFAMAVGYNNTALGFRTIPAGYTAFLFNYNISMNNTASSGLLAELTIRYGETGLLRKKKHFGGHSQGSNVIGSFGGTESLAEKSFLRWDATVGANNSQVSCSTTILLIAN